MSYISLKIVSTSTHRSDIYKVMVTKEGPDNIVNFMTPGAGVLVLGRDHISIDHIHV